MKGFNILLSSPDSFNLSIVSASWNKRSDIRMDKGCFDLKRLHLLLQSKWKVESIGQECLGNGQGRIVPITIVPDCSSFDTFQG